MAKIFYSMAGEGRGHAVRARTVVEHLRRDHELVLFAPGDAFDFLNEWYGERKIENVRLLRIPGLRFCYARGRLNFMKSAASAMEFAFREMPTLVNAIRQRIDSEQPDLAISDFEPILPRAAREAGLPWMTLDHQHVLLAYNLGNIPLKLQHYVWWMGWGVRWCYGRDHYPAVTSSFFTAPLKPGFENIRQIGSLLRPEVIATQPQTGDYLVSYLRSNTSQRVIDALANCGWPVRIYGLGQRPTSGRLSFHAIDENRFVADLAGSAGLFSAAGNQVLGEAIYYGKPVFAIPESMLHEQLINAHYLKQMGGGDWTPAESFNPDTFHRFLNRIEDYRLKLADRVGATNGTPDAINAIDKVLQKVQPDDLHVMV
jgi:uncharacterized protein (TIGR00661 family)